MWSFTITQSGVILYAVLASVVLFGALVSLSLKPGIRGWRNLALLAAYVLGIVSLFVVPFLLAVVVWVCTGAAVGLVYAVFDLWTASRVSDEESKSSFQFGDVLNGPLLWPLMFMEVFENIYAHVTGQGPTEDPKTSVPLQPPGTSE